MPRDAKIFLALGALAALLGVALGAFGAHALKPRLSPDMLALWKTGVEYHFYHALGLLAIGVLALHFPRARLLPWSGWLMLAGVILFSGSLYAFALGGAAWLAMITPFGGTAFLAAWALALAAVLGAV